MQLEFHERWRCSAAKSQLEQGCAAARAAQNARLADALLPDESHLLKARVSTRSTSTV